MITGLATLRIGKVDWAQAKNGKWVRYVVFDSPLHGSLLLQGFVNATIADGVMTLTLVSGDTTLIDEADAPFLLGKTWLGTASSGRNRSLYLTASQTGGGRYAMHRLLLAAGPGNSVDHRNGDGLDNRRVNLRIATPGQNNKNLPMYRTNKSGYKGVYKRSPGSDQWMASITNEGKRAYMGPYSSPKEAAKAYDRKAEELHGEFARLNNV